MLDVIIIGAGMAGLSAALALKEERKSFIIFEAMPHAGGRASSLITPAGTPVDLGGHWLHGEDNPLKKLLDHYGLHYSKDKNRHLRVYKDGKMEEEKGTKWLDECVDQKKAKQIKSGTLPDCPLSEIAADERGREILKDFALMWNGLEPPLEPSALEFLTDKSTPGGYLPENGVADLFAHMQKDIGTHHIHFNTVIASIHSRERVVEVMTKKGDSFTARKVFFTPSLGVLTSGTIKFNPPLSKKLTHDLSSFVMGKVNKIIVELPKSYFDERRIPDNFSLELLDAKPPHFCYVSPPLITLFASGNMAEEVEKMSREEALKHLRLVLKPVKELHGFEDYMLGDPIVTHWVGNPYTKGSYSACLPGGKRSWPREEGQVYLCGDMFDPHYFSSLAGAFRSGQAAARLFAQS